MRELKYVIVQRNEYLEPKAIIFNGEIVHMYMIPVGYKCISAGFCNIIPQSFSFNIEVYGESTSLGLKSNPKDADIINLTLTNNHFM